MTKFFQKLLDKYDRNKIVVRVGWYDVSDLEQLAVDLQNKKMIYYHWIPKEKTTIGGREFPLHINGKTCAFYYFNSFEKFMYFKLSYSGILNFNVGYIRYNYLNMRIDNNLPDTDVSGLGI